MTENTVTTVDKPWGCYVDYFRSDNVVFKKLILLANQKLSYQYHENRSEFWYIASGTGLLTVNGKQEVVEAGYHVLIEKEQKHSIECIANLITGFNVALVIYEMQFGECDEDDIVRLEDKYGRIE